MPETGFKRIADGIRRGTEFSILVDGEPIVAFSGETVATALLAGGRLVLRHTEKQQQPRGIFCGMGICFDCLMTVNGVPNVQTCVTPAEPGMIVTTQHGLPGVCTDADH